MRLSRWLCRLFGHRWTSEDVPDYCQRCAEVALYYDDEEPPGWVPNLDGGD